MTPTIDKYSILCFVKHYLHADNYSLHNLEVFNLVIIYLRSHHIHGRADSLLWNPWSMRLSIVRDIALKCILKYVLNVVPAIQWTSNCIQNYNKNIK